MLTILRPALLSAALMVLPAGLALAASGDAVSAANEQPVSGGIQLPNASNPHVAGATGRTIVLGNHSTIASDAEATEMQRTGGYERD